MPKEIELREELHQEIDVLPLRQIKLIKSIIDEFNENDKFVIETDLTAEEIESVERSKERYKNNPDSFISLDNLIEKYNVQL